MNRLFAVVALVALMVLVGCSSVATNNGTSQGSHTMFLAQGSFVTVPIQPWFCDPTRDTYCPIESRGLVGDTADKVMP